MARRLSRRELRLIAALAVLASFAALVGAAVIADEIYRGRHWTRTTCTVTELTFTEHAVRLRTLYWPEITYAYVVADAPQVGKHVSFAYADGVGPDARDALAKTNGVGTEVPCWFDERDPDQVVLDRAGKPTVFHLAGAIVIFVGSVIVLVRMARRRLSAADPA